MSLFIRITRSYDDVKEWIQKVSDSSSSVIVYEHIGEKGKRVHIHLLVEGCQVATETLKRWLTATNGLFFKSDWSFKEKHEGNPVDRGTITYMSKGKLQPVFVKDITQQDIYEFTSKWKKYDIPDKKKNDKATQFQMVMEMVDIARESNLDFTNLSECFGLISRVLRKYSVITSLYKMRDYYDSIRLYMDSHTLKEDFCNLVARSYAPVNFPR